MVLQKINKEISWLGEDISKVTKKNKNRKSLGHLKKIKK